MPPREGKKSRLAVWRAGQTFNVRLSIARVRAHRDGKIRYRPARYGRSILDRSTHDSTIFRRAVVSFVFFFSFFLSNREEENDVDDGNHASDEEDRHFYNL